MASCHVVALASSQLTASFHRAQCLRRADALHLDSRAPPLSRATAQGEPRAAVRQSAQSARGGRRSVRVLAAGERKDEAGSAGERKDAEKVPGWAQPGNAELPPWARSEAQREKPFEVPFWAYLVASVLVAIAAVGSIFEYTAGNPLFGVVGSDSALWAPTLLLFATTGIPSSGYLLYLAIQAANKAAREADEQDMV
ncbi:hypothetical protein CLOM_g11190 [Closterium sp. NIES-68]|nr:hypothetical protein CLOM_g11190 [Closterium sp. NIES-68]GJP64842.1 hypothetical protein CLOP_g21784 [Closterium sp. NIES-67]